MFFVYCLALVGLMALIASAIIGLIAMFDEPADADDPRDEITDALAAVERLQARAWESAQEIQADVARKAS